MNWRDNNYETHSGADSPATISNTMNKRGVTLNFLKCQTGVLSLHYRNPPETEFISSDAKHEKLFLVVCCHRHFYTKRARTVRN
jgi:hypothetical protein